MNTESTDPKAGEGQDLFGLKPVAAVEGGKPAVVGSVTTARVILPNRTQIELRPMDLESLLPEGHRGRLVWAWVERQDLSAMYAAIKVREGGVGRSAIATQVLLGMWLYAPARGRPRSDARPACRTTWSRRACGCARSRSNSKPTRRRTSRC